MRKFKVIKEFEIEKIENPDITIVLSEGAELTLLPSDHMLDSKYKYYFSYYGDVIAVDKDFEGTYIVEI